MAVVVVVVLIALGVWWHSTYSEDTDDAQVNGHLIQVSSRINGQVAKVYVEENQVVKAGDLIAELDPSDYQVAVENAEAALASARANAAAANVNVPIVTVNTGSNLRSADADVSGTQASVAQAEQQLAGRAGQRGSGPGQQYQGPGRFGALQAAGRERRHQQAAVRRRRSRGRRCTSRPGRGAPGEQAAADAVRVAHERETQAQAMLKYAADRSQQVAAQSARARQAEAQVEQAQAQLDQAKLNLSYTKIVAPAAGIITRKSVEINQNVSAGQNLLTLVSLEDLWVTANFKETQLRHMQAGQKVEIHVDSTGKDYSGTRHADWRRHRLRALALPAGKRYRQLRQGGAARSGAHRLYRPGKGRPQPRAAAGALRGAEGRGEVKEAGCFRIARRWQRVCRDALAARSYYLSGYKAAALQRCLPI